MPDVDCGSCCLPDVPARADLDNLCPTCFAEKPFHDAIQVARARLMDGTHASTLRACEDLRDAMTALVEKIKAPVAA